VFSRFRELDRAALNVDLQVHSARTDGEGSVGEILRRARERGLSAIALTEHVRRDSDWFLAFAKGVCESARSFPGLRVYVGCEAKALDADGSLDASEEILSRCDIVLGSVHRFPDGRGGTLEFDSLDPGSIAEIECELALGLLRAAPIDVLAHPGGMSQRRLGAFPEEFWRRLLEASLERGIAVEINASYLADVPGFLRLCSEINPFVSIGSDAHRLSEIGRCRDMLLALDPFPR
jgi:putative hydrolase